MSRYLYDRHPDGSGDLEASLDRYFRMTGAEFDSSLSPSAVATMVGPGKVPLAHEPPCPAASHISHDQGAGGQVCFPPVSSLNLVDLSKSPAPGHPSILSFSKPGGIPKWERTSHRKPMENTSG